MTKNKFAYLSALVLFLSSCTSISGYVANNASDSCPYVLTEEKFNLQVADSFEDKTLKSALQYEKFINTIVVKDVYDLLSIIREKHISEANFESISLDIIKLMKDEINNHKIIAKYIKDSDATVYGISSKDRVVKFIDQISVDNLSSGIALFTKYKNNFLKGELPPEISLSSGKVFFCHSDKKDISGDKSLNSLMHILNAIYVKIDPEGYKNKIKKDKTFADLTYSFKVLPLPRKFIVSDAYSQVKNSIYVQKLGNNSYGFTLVNNAYDDIYTFSRNARKEFSEDFKYSPWYSKIFNIKPNITQEHFLAFHRIKYGQDYVASHIVNALSEYNEFLQYFEPIKITNPAKQIKPAQLILIRDFAKTSVNIDELVNGNSGTLGLIMDYDPIDKIAIILTDRENVGSKKTGLGFDPIALSASLVRREYFIFNQKQDALKDIQSLIDEPEAQPLQEDMNSPDKNDQKNQLAGDNYDIAKAEEDLGKTIDETGMTQPSAPNSEYHTLGENASKTTNNLMTQKK